MKLKVIKPVYIYSISNFENDHLKIFSPFVIKYKVFSKQELKKKKEKKIYANFTAAFRRDTAENRTLKKIICFAK